VSETVARIETLLRQAFEPVTLQVEDESALHAGHAGARSGGGHYRVTIVSAAFAGKNTVARHRLIYAALGDLIPGAIHALAIRASTPDEL
jgi:BolA protein